MIPFDYITEWRAQAPWIEDAQVEQDLVISRALVEIFTILRSPIRLLYEAARRSPSCTFDHPPVSEDIDLVQTHPNLPDR